METLSLPAIINPYSLPSFVNIVADTEEVDDNEEDDYEGEAAVAAAAAAEIIAVEEDAEADHRYFGKLAHKTISKWIQIDILDRDSRLVAKSEKQLSSKRSRITLETSNTKIPDVGVYTSSKVCPLQIEEHSGSYERTCRKLVQI